MFSSGPSFIPTILCGDRPKPKKHVAYSFSAHHLVVLDATDHLLCPYSYHCSTRLCASVVPNSLQEIEASPYETM